MFVILKLLFSYLLNNVYNDTANKPKAKRKISI